MGQQVWAGTILDRLECVVPLPLSQMLVANLSVNMLWDFGKLISDLWISVFLYKNKIWHSVSLGGFPWVCNTLTPCCNGIPKTEMFLAAEIIIITITITIIISTVAASQATCLLVGILLFCYFHISLYMDVWEASMNKNYKTTKDSNKQKSLGGTLDV